MSESPLTNASPKSDASIAFRSLFVATIYEDEAAADRARRLMSRILQMAGHAEPVQEYTCGLQFLDHPDGPAATARRAGSVDVLVVAMHSDSPALGRVADWLTYWLAPQRRKPGALVSMTIEQPEASAAPSSNEKRLSSIAAQIDMNFFSTRLPAAVEFIDDTSSA